MAALGPPLPSSLLAILVVMKPVSVIQLMLAFLKKENTIQNVAPNISTTSSPLNNWFARESFLEFMMRRRRPREDSETLFFFSGMARCSVRVTHLVLRICVHREFVAMFLSLYSNTIISVSLSGLLFLVLSLVLDSWLFFHIWKR